ncbi:MAG TPA: dicarboxylate/amino acid:cation symporter [Parvularcula sp.]|nr:dicarboxylate/amino acid:cation symporter [Parvularcula sp.]HBS31457.1 dicarboxylate/amino acid:cation symporter [Parvularcula sp.]HBS34059.1 dicarboxylate/amino acid:cation symporter [Parvularcula sp.]
MAKRLFQIILIAMLLGVAAGWAAHAQLDVKGQADFAAAMKIVTDIFLRLIKMVIAPLVLTTLIVGIAHMRDPKTLGRVGLRTMIWFIAASLFSLALGLVMVNLIQPGAGFDASPPDAVAVAPTAENFTLANFITHLVPRSIIEAMATNEILQIVIFSVFAGVALAKLGEKTAKVVDMLEQGAYLMLKITEYVMLLAPFAVFAALAGVVATKGLGVIITYGKFVGGFYLSLLILWAALAFAGRLVIGRRIGELVAAIREPVIIAFSTASSEAAYPKLLERLERFGVPNRIASFVLPLGYSFNLDGSMMYCAFATLFIAQAYGVEMTAVQQITMLLFLMVTSKGMAAVPRASLVVIAATLTAFNLPADGLLLLLAVDQFLDMGRSGTNIVGNSVATAAVAKWEGMLRDSPLAPPLAERALDENAGAVTASRRG